MSAVSCRLQQAPSPATGPQHVLVQYHYKKLSFINIVGYSASVKIYKTTNLYNTLTTAGI